MPRDAAAERLADLGFVALCGRPRAGANNGGPGSGEQTRGTGSSSGCANHGSQTSGTDSSSASNGNQTRGTDSSSASNGNQTRGTDISGCASNGSQTGKRKHRWYHSGDAVGNGCGPSQASPICHDPAGRSKTCQGSKTCQAGRR